MLRARARSSCYIRSFHHPEDACFCCSRQTASPTAPPRFGCCQPAYSHWTLWYLYHSSASDFDSVPAPHTWAGHPLPTILRRLIDGRQRQRTYGIAWASQWPPPPWPVWALVCAGHAAPAALSVDCRGVVVIGGMGHQARWWRPRFRLAQVIGGQLDAYHTSFSSSCWRSVPRACSRNKGLKR